MVVELMLVVLVALPLDAMQGRRRRRAEQRPGQRTAACLVLAGAAATVIASCALPWWETSNGRVFPPERSTGRLGEPLVTVIIIGIVVAGLLRLGIVQQKLTWGAGSVQTVTWVLFLVAVFVANPQITGTDTRGDFGPGYFVGLAAAGLVSISGFLVWPRRAGTGTADAEPVPGRTAPGWPTETSIR